MRWLAISRPGLLKNRDLTAADQARIRLNEHRWHHASLHRCRAVPTTIMPINDASANLIAVYDATANFNRLKSTSANFHQSNSADLPASAVNQRYSHCQ